MIRVCSHFPLRNLNAFALDVYANHFVEYQTEEELRQWLLGDGKHDAVLPVGQGSNLLFTADYPGTVLHACSNRLQTLDRAADRVLLRVEAGVLWDDVVRYAVARGWTGAENLAGIPGQAGSAAVQNIGAYGADVAQIIASVHAMDKQGRMHAFSNNACCYGYRSSFFKQADDLYVTAVDFSFIIGGSLNVSYGNMALMLDQMVQQGHPRTAATVAAAVRHIRAAKLPDPQVLPNAGSFFKNPVVPELVAQNLKVSFPDMPVYPASAGQVKLSAAWLIEQCGWKGKALGGAGVDRNHALILVNNGGATGNEISQLAHQITASVQARFDIVLAPEVRFI